MYVFSLSLSKRFWGPYPFKYCLYFVSLLSFFGSQTFVCVKTFWGPGLSTALRFSRSEVGFEICISDKFPVDAAAGSVLSTLAYSSLDF